MKIKYQFATGNSEIEVSEEWADILIDLDRQEYNNILNYKTKHRPYPKSNEKTKYCDNTLNRNFAVFQANMVWCGDITYIKTATGWIYRLVGSQIQSLHVVQWQGSS